MYKPFELKKEQFKQVNIKVTAEHLKKIETVLKGIDKLDKHPNFSRNTLIYLMLESAIESNVAIINYEGKEYSFSELLAL
ncbi:hypothetical protein [Clostridium sp.]|uniref:hypothetical protein n=1 Tax=Clostridium sp. TaxID=1506 RepID=UPI00260722A7|nr:hypothetical protein [uncultured Clostridium sp.]